MAEEALLPPLEEIMALSTRLTDHADSIANAAAHEMETDLRKASDLLRRYVTLLANMDDDEAADRFGQKKIERLVEHYNASQTPALLKCSATSFAARATYAASKYRLRLARKLLASLPQSRHGRRAALGGTPRAD
jgi:hypothetical protein